MTRYEQALALKKEGLSDEEVAECMGIFSAKGHLGIARMNAAVAALPPRQGPHNPPPAVTCQCGTDVQDIAAHNNWHGKWQLYRWKTC